MDLVELARQIAGARLVGAGSTAITAVSCDSRTVESGTLFAALPGAKADGSAFVPDAVRRGAAALLLARPLPEVALPQILVAEPHRAVGEAAAALRGHPTRHLRLLGVTGTNGKTTVAYLLADLLRRAGGRVGLLGTIVYDTGGRSVPAPLTTPDAVTFTDCLAEMVAHGREWAVAEVSSHALAQDRVWPHRFACGIFTNLTRDHLDYHPDMEHYLQSKKRLFDRLAQDAWAVGNADDPACARLLQDTPAHTCTYAVEAGADLRATVRENTLAGLSFDLAFRGTVRTVRTRLVGRHNLQNCLAALAALHCLGQDLDAAAARLADFPGVPGRLERIDSPDGVTAFVDYAHTDDALRSVLRVLRPLTPGRLVVVFGCGGDRDRGKRPLMARVSEELADRVVVTSDNPRTENPEAIIAEVCQGLSHPQAALVIPDRRAAVTTAIHEARRGDVVLVAGKGHEDYQIIGTERHHLDDRELVRAAMEKPHA